MEPQTPVRWSMDSHDSVDTPQQIPVPSTLYHKSLAILSQLYAIPNFDFYLFPPNSLSTDPDSIIDPVSILWSCFKLGAPLAHLYNQGNAGGLEIPDVSQWIFDKDKERNSNVLKKPVAQFLIACKDELSLTDDEKSATVLDLYREDTNSFVKVLGIVEKLIASLTSRNLLPPPRPLPFSAKALPSASTISDYRSKLILELLETERKYISDLELLQSYHRVLLEKSAITKETSRIIFSNLNAVLDVQRRFLVGLETMLSVDDEKQMIGSVFLNMEKQFSVYDIFCGNYEKAVQEAVKEQASLGPFSYILDPVTGLPSYLIKPVQRICKYPLFLKDLISCTDFEAYPNAKDLEPAYEAMKRVADGINEYKRKEENLIVKADLIERVEDWKDLRPVDFGDLLIHDKFPMATSPDTPEKEYYVYLFDTIMICLKEIIADKKRRSSKKDKTTEYSFILRGNISITHIEEVEDFSVPPNLFGLKIHWRDRGDREQFSLKCRNIEQVKLWKDRLDRLMYDLEIRKRSLGSAPSAIPTGPAPTGWVTDTEEDESVRPTNNETPPRSRRGTFSKVITTATSVMRARSRSQSNHRTPQPQTPTHTITFNSPSHPSRKSSSGGINTPVHGMDNSYYPQEIFGLTSPVTNAYQAAQTSSNGWSQMSQMHQAFDPANPSQILSISENLQRLNIAKNDFDQTNVDYRRPSHPPKEGMQRTISSNNLQSIQKTPSTTNVAVLNRNVSGTSLSGMNRSQSGTNLTGLGQPTGSPVIKSSPQYKPSNISFPRPPTNEVPPQKQLRSNRSMNDMKAGQFGYDSPVYDQQQITSQQLSQLSEMYRRQQQQILQTPQPVMQSPQMQSISMPPQGQQTYTTYNNGYVGRTPSNNDLYSLNSVLMSPPPTQPLPIPPVQQSAYTYYQPQSNSSQKAPTVDIYGQPIAGVRQRKGSQNSNSSGGYEPQYGYQRRRSNTTSGGENFGSSYGSQGSWQ
ncbi:hypothetical protein HK098_004082 [Nowakowskiella sp. JEL0407]|nr:hypothetical protein HK098_004082 [Nowakowskiella sp. JEL0407]